MAKVKRPPPFLTRLEQALVDDLKANQIKADVDIEAVATTRLYRVTVVAPKFKALKHSERQSLVWRIAEKTLSPEEQLRISMILTLTREEAEGQ
jgi:hypothetical protein